MKILRERHPFEGRTLQILGELRRGGLHLLLLTLPDGSRTLIPAQWTDWKKTQIEGAPLPQEDNRQERCFAALADLLRLRTIVDSLLRRDSTLRSASIVDKESNHAIDACVSRNRTFDPTADTVPKRRDDGRSPKVGDRDHGADNCAKPRGDGTDGGLP